MEDKKNQLKVGFGDRVTFTQAVQGMHSEEFQRHTKRELFEYIPEKLTGIVIGRRNLQEGTVYHGRRSTFFDEGEPPEFRVDNYIPVYLVAINMRSNPIYVRIEDIETVIHEA